MTRSTTTKLKRATGVASIIAFVQVVISLGGGPWWGASVSAVITATFVGFIWFLIWCFSND